MQAKEEKESEQFCRYGDEKFVKKYKNKCLISPPQHKIKFPDDINHYPHAEV